MRAAAWLLVFLLAPTMVTASADAELSRGTRRFALDAYLRASEAEPRGNLVLSPFSLTAAFAMTAAGARGRTEAQLESALGLSGWKAHRTLGDLGSRLEASRGASLRVANRIFGQQGFSFEEPFRRTCEDHYRAPLEELNFSRAPEASRQRINDWVADRTEQRILDLVPRGGVTSATRLVLANAIWFKGTWALEFDPAATRPLPFLVAGRSPRAVPTMRRELEVPHARGRGYELVELPYRGDELAMVVLLPEEDLDLATLETSLDPEELEANLHAATRQKVDVFLPRFELRTELDARSLMEDLGVVDLFGAEADLTGMHAAGGLHVSAAFHEAFVKVDEQGTEAAAATAVIVMATGFPPPTPVFRVDRPFLFLIRHRPSGTWLFMGRVTDPS